MIRNLQTAGLYRLFSCFAAAAFAFSILTGCEKPPPPAPLPEKAAANAPNFLIIIWDTARRDSLSLHGHPKATTPAVDQWAKGARIFDNCISPGTTTLPAHASIFTGLLPTEHGVSHRHEFLDSGFDTLAEILQRAGYRTYLFSANNYIAAEFNFTKGFDVSEHPWSATFAPRAYEIIRAKVAEDRSSELTGRIDAGAAAALRIRQNIKAAGELAIEGLGEWLKSSDNGRPFFAFVNWMEAHRQLIPPRKFRDRFMTPEEVERSYHVNRSWARTWEYTVGRRDLSEEELYLTRATYEAAIAELDDLFARLMESLRVAGKLENTIVILTSDHGEHLGEHHMLDHQFSAYEELLRVPLIVADRDRMAPGRDESPVMTHDLFPTLLERAGLTVPRAARAAVSLYTPHASRARLAEYPAAMMGPLQEIANRDSSFKYEPWKRSLRAWYSGDYKLIRSSDGRHELYDLKNDASESTNLASTDRPMFDRLMTELMTYRRTMKAYVPGASPSLSPEAQNRKTETGYSGGNEAEEDAAWGAD